MKSCWIPISPNPTGNYLATPGNRYAALLSVDSRAKLSDVTDALAKQDFTVTYSWQTGQANRQQFFIDNWIADLPAPTQGTIWIYLELNYTGDMPKTIARHVQKCVLWICGNVDIAYIFEAQQVDDGYHPCGPGDPQKSPDAASASGTSSTPGCPDLPPPCPAPPPQPNPWKPALVGAGAVTAVGLLVAAIRG